jgi:hypothetical protein
VTRRKQGRVGVVEDGGSATNGAGEGEVAAAGSGRRRGEDDGELEKELQLRRASRATGAGNRGAMGIGREARV